MNDTARATLAAFLAHAGHILQNEARVAGLPTVLHQRAIFGDDGSLAWVTRAEPYWHRFVRDCWPVLEQSEAKQRFLAAVEEEPLCPQPPLSDGSTPTRSQTQAFIVEKLHRLLIDHLERAGGEFDAASIDAQVNRFVTSWMASEYRRHAIVPVLYCDSTVREVRFDDSLVLAPLSGETKTRLWNDRFGYTTSASREPIAVARLAFVDSYATAQPHHSVSSARASGLALFAMRLVREGGAVITLAVDEPIPDRVFDSGGNSEIGVYRAPRAPFGGRYHLDEKTARSVVATYSRLQRLSRKHLLRQLGVARRKFEDAYHRERDDDRLIDLVIALEATLGRGLHRHKRKRMQERGARLLAGRSLGDGPAHVIDDAYRARNRIVHEGSALTRRDGGEELISSLREVVAGVIDEIARRLDDGAGRLPDILSSLG